MKLVNSNQTTSDLTKDKHEREEKMRAASGYFAYRIDATLNHIRKHRIRSNDIVPFKSKQAATDPPKSIFHW